MMTIATSIIKHILYMNDMPPRVIFFDEAVMKTKKKINKYICTHICRKGLIPEAPFINMDQL